MPSTEGSAQPSTIPGGVVIPSPCPSFGHSRSRVSLVSELLRWSLSGAATVEQPRGRSTLSASAFGPSSRRLAPGHQPVRCWLGSRTWVWCLPARSRLCGRTNEAFDLPTNRGRQKPSEPSAYTVVGFGGDDPSPTEPWTYAAGSIVKGHGPDREGPKTDAETAPLASQPLRRRDSLRQGVCGRLRTPRFACRLRASATVTRASHLYGDRLGR